MAGTVTPTTTELGGGLTKYSIAWLSDGAGAVSGTTVALKRGELRQVEYIPDSGASQPDAAYDVTMTGPNGDADILGGTGANLSQTVASVHVPAVSTYFRRFLVAGNYTPVVAGAGSANGGTIVLLVQE